MEDFNALAAALGAGIHDVRSCLILSSDGLVLGAHPESAEEDARPARIKVAALGEPERGFLQFGTEVWCYVRRGPYAALAITGTSIRPGLVLDQMEQALLAAEDARSRRDALRFEPAAPPTPTTRPRTPLHPDPRPVEQPVVIRADALDTRGRAGSGGAPALAGSSPDVPATGAASADEPEPGLEDARRDEPAGPPPDGTVSDDGPSTPHDEHAEVDRFSLAREFSRLLQDDQAPADG